MTVFQTNFLHNFWIVKRYLKGRGYKFMNEKKRIFLFALLFYLTIFLGCEDSDSSNYSRTIIETPSEY